MEPYEIADIHRDLLTEEDILVTHLVGDGDTSGVHAIRKRYEDPALGLTEKQVDAVVPDTLLCHNYHVRNVKCGHHCCKLHSAADMSLAPCRAVLHFTMGQLWCRSDYCFVVQVNKHVRSAGSERTRSKRN